MATDPGQLEAMIAREARRVLDNPERPPTPDLSLGLQSLLSHHFRDSEGTSFDGVVQPTIRIRKDHRLEVRGLMVCAQRGSPRQWVELFGADLHPAEDQDVLHDYVLYFGRGDLPGRKVAYEQRTELLAELRKAGDWSWAHVFKRDRR
jgi:hypothetical protein